MTLTASAPNSRRSARAAKGTEKASATDPRRPAMTADEATSFHTASISSCMQVADALAERAANGTHTECQCEAYADVFTFNRWKAQGFNVQKGETALRVSSLVEARRGDGDASSEPTTDGASPKRRMFPKTVFLFCRCQVQPIATPEKTGK